jgi:hypothetical protein
MTKGETIAEQIIQPQTANHQEFGYQEDAGVPKQFALALFLRVYGVLSLFIFSPLFLGFLLQTPLPAEGESLNWTI